MITVTYLQQIGYSLKQSANIMQRLKKLGCNYTSVEMTRDYVRNGRICHMIHFCDAIDTKEALELLGAYIEHIKINSNRNFWNKVLNDLRNSKTNVHKSN